MDETMRMVKASNYNDLTVKASSLFKVNPNTAVLTFQEPDGEKMVLDSEDTYEYIEMRAQELKEQNSSYKPQLTLEGDTSKAKRQSENSLQSQASSVSRASALITAVKPILEHKPSEEES